MVGTRSRICMASHTQRRERCVRWPREEHVPLARTALAAVLWPLSCCDGLAGLCAVNPRMGCTTPAALDPRKQAPPIGAKHHASESARQPTARSSFSDTNVAACSVWIRCRSVRPASTLNRRPRAAWGRSRSRYAAGRPRCRRPRRQTGAPPASPTLPDTSSSPLPAHPFPPFPLALASHAQSPLTVPSSHPDTSSSEPSSTMLPRPPPQTQRRFTLSWPTRGATVARSGKLSAGHSVWRPQAILSLGPAKSGGWRGDQPLDREA